MENITLDSFEKGRIYKSSRGFIGEFIEVRVVGGDDCLAFKNARLEERPEFDGWFCTTPFSECLKFKWELLK